MGTRSNSQTSRYLFKEVELHQVCFANDNSRPRLRLTEEDCQLTLVWKTVKMAEDQKLLLHKLPIFRVVQEDHIRNVEYRFLKWAISSLR